MNKKGFTLTEIIAVIILISIIVAIAIPSVIAIRNRINQRILEGKKETILIAAELYGQDNPQLFNPNEFIVTVGELVDAGYVEKDVEENDKNCTDGYGCVINPVDNISLNQVEILVKKEVNTIIAIWDGELGSSTSSELVDKIIEDLHCENITESNPCLYIGSNPNNYLWYSGVMWRIMGVYKINGVLVVKMITDDNITFENTTG